MFIPYRTSRGHLFFQGYLIECDIDNSYSYPALTKIIASAIFPFLLGQLNLYFVFKLCIPLKLTSFLLSH